MTFLLPPMSAPCDSTCGQLLRDGYANDDIEVTVTTTPSLIDTGYEPLNMRCPHGLMWYAEPTSDQIAVWRGDGVA